MKKTKIFMIAITVIIVIIASFKAFGDMKNTTPDGKIKIRMPTATSSGTLYATGAAITHMWNEKIPTIKASVQSSAGGIENLNMVNDGEAQVSIAISSNCYQSFHGTDIFKGHANPHLRVIAGLYLNPNQVIATDKSEINKIEDIKGKRFAIASAGSSVYNEVKTHLETANIKVPDDIQAEYIGFGEAAAMLQNKTIDGAWIMAGVPSSSVMQTLSSNSHLVNLSDDFIKQMQKKYPWYVAYTIPKGTYPDQKTDIQTTAVKMVMFCNEDLPDEVVYELTKAFWENVEELSKTQKSLKNLTPQEAVKNIADLPIHNGAMKYYKEINAI